LNNPYNTSPDYKLELDKDDLDDALKGDSNNNLLFNKEQHLLEYYLAKADCLNVTMLQQQQYSNGFQKKLNKTREYRDR
jgi:hypothetical protein